MTDLHRQPRVSIIVPVYNGARHLSQCLESIASQSCPSFEAICVDDGSTDETLRILQEFAERDRRFTVMSQENAGPGIARNKALDQARGEFVYCCDADDFLYRNLLERCLLVFDAEQADMVVVAFDTFNQACGRTLFADWSMRHADVYPSYPHGFFTWKTAPDVFFETIQNVPWNKMVRKGLLDAHSIRFQEQYLTEDLLYSCPAAVCAGKIVRVAEPLLAHREFLATNAMADKGRHPMDFLHAFKALKAWLEGKGVYSELQTSYRNWLLDAVYYNLLSYRSFEAFSEAYEALVAHCLQDFDLAGIDPEAIADPRHKALYRALQLPSKEQFLLATTNLLVDEQEEIICDFQAAQTSKPWLIGRMFPRLASRIRR